MPEIQWYFFQPPSMTFNLGSRPYFAVLLTALCSWLLEPWCT